jgi:hypothetical protein
VTLNVSIAAPCSEKWESMTGDARARHCAKCQLNVYNVSELTEPEVMALFQKTEGRVCGRIYRRPDGTVLTKDCPTGVALLRRRALAALTMAAALLLAVIGVGLFRSKKSCPTDENATWFDRTVGARVIDARETLRDTKTLGPLINELWPAPATFTAGLMVATPPAPTTGSP